ncbi:MAG: TonB family protein, partial [Vicinamibacteria bacterium]
MMTPARVPLPIESLPSGATVRLDGVEVGTTPITIVEAALGEHEISIAKEGFVPMRESVNLGPDGPPLVFALQPARVSLSVASTPTPAYVFVDDEEVGNTPLKEALLDEGSHRLEVRRQGFQPFRVELDARVGESLHYVARLQPMDAPKAVAAPKAEAPVPTEAVPTVAELGDAGVVSPQKISGNFARYPEAARRMRVSGVVTVTMVISEAGIPEELQVVESGGPVLDQAVVKAVEKWRFTPASRDGQPVRIR